MDFLDALKEKINRTTHVVAKKSNELVEITKLRAAAADVEREIDKTLRNIGQALYESYKTGDDAFASVEEACAELDDAYAKAAELQAKIAELRHVKKCPVCGKDMERDAAFCSVCGAKFE